MWQFASGSKEYDFYTPENICIIDRNHPKVPNGFLESVYKEIPKNVYERYSLKNWLKVVFEGY